MNHGCKIMTGKTWSWIIIYHWLQPYTSWPTMQKADSLDQEAAGPPEYPHQLAWATTDTAQTLKQKQEFRQKRRQQWQIAKDMERPNRQEASIQQQPTAKSRCRPSQFRHHLPDGTWGLGMAGKPGPLRVIEVFHLCHEMLARSRLALCASLAVGLACSFSQNVHSVWIKLYKLYNKYNMWKQRRQIALTFEPLNLWQNSQSPFWRR